MTIFFLLKEKTREQKEADLIPKIQEAVNYGLQVLDSAFEQLDIKAGNSDSEEEESNERVELILEPKVQRPVFAERIGFVFLLLDLLFISVSSNIIFLSNSCYLPKKKIWWLYVKLKCCVLSYFFNSLLVLQLG